METPETPETLQKLETLDCLKEIKIRVPMPQDENDLQEIQKNVCEMIKNSYMEQRYQIQSKKDLPLFVLDDIVDGCFIAIIGKEGDKLGTDLLNQYQQKDPTRLTHGLVVSHSISSIIKNYLPLKKIAKLNDYVLNTVMNWFKETELLVPNSVRHCCVFDSVQETAQQLIEHCLLLRDECTQLKNKFNFIHIQKTAFLLNHVDYVDYLFLSSESFYELNESQFFQIAHFIPIKKVVERLSFYKYLVIDIKKQVCCFYQEKN